MMIRLRSKAILEKNLIVDKAKHDAHGLLRPAERKMSKKRTRRQQRMCNVWYVNKRTMEGNQIITLM